MLLQNFDRLVEEMERAVEIEDRSYQGIPDEPRRRVTEQNEAAWYEQLEQATEAYKALYAQSVRAWTAQASPDKGGQVFDHLSDIRSEWGSRLRLFEEAAGPQPVLDAAIKQLGLLAHRGTFNMRLLQRPVTRLLKAYTESIQGLLEA